jgi:hypothetical protein
MFFLFNIDLASGRIILLLVELDTAVFGVPAKLKVVETSGDSLTVTNSSIISMA